MRAAAFIGAIAAGLTLMPLLGAEGEYTINRRLVSREEFLARAVPIMAAWAVVLLAFAWAVWRRRAWARPVALGFWPLYAIFGWRIGQPSRAGAVAFSLVSLGMLAVTAWYLYRKPNVRAYYDALRGAGSRPQRSEP